MGRGDPAFPGPKSPGKRCRFRLLDLPRKFFPHVPLAATWRMGVCGEGGKSPSRLEAKSVPLSRVRAHLAPS